MKLDVRLDPDPEAPGLARRALERLAGKVRPDIMDNLNLLVSELVTNSVRHAGLSPGDRIEVRVELTAAAVRVEVADAGPGFDPEIHSPTIYQDSGWGLYLVGQVSDRWGVESGRPTCVWFELDRTDPSRPTG